MSNHKPLKFVDLFCGLGGFHLALSDMGHKCVFASEIDDQLREVYAANFGLRPASDIRFSWKDVPKHDVLCAGFPCQPFSKAGAQKGFDCSDSGDLFNFILKVIDLHRPQYLIFENVPNITRHDNGQTFKQIQRDLRIRGYSVDHKELSPHQFGIPQVRPRVIIVGSLTELSKFRWPKPKTSNKHLHISSVLDTPNLGSDKLSDEYLNYLDTWEDFLRRIPATSKMPSFPIWGMEFEANYPMEQKTPSSCSSEYLASYCGTLGQSLDGLTKEQQIASLPPYARNDTKQFPSWKKRFIRQNRAFYSEHRSVLKSWLPKIEDFPASFQKFEWNWQDGSRTVWDKVIQFRASGIRVKNPATSPSLVALTTSQVPVIAWEKRYMTMQECARLQSMDSLKNLPNNKTSAYKALGNAVNVDLIKLVGDKLLTPDNRLKKVS